MAKEVKTLQALMQEVDAKETDINKVIEQRDLHEKGTAMYDIIDKGVKELKVEFDEMLLKTYRQVNVRKPAAESVEVPTDLLVEADENDE